MAGNQKMYISHPFYSIVGLAVILNDIKPF